MESEQIELGYGDVLRILRDSWAVILSLVFVGGLIAGIIAFTMQPIYRAQVLLAPASPDSASGSSLSRLAGQFAPLAGLVGGLDASGGLENKDVKLATLRARYFTERFIQDQNLLPVLFSEKWDAAAGNWKARHGKSSAPTMFDAVRLFNEDVRSISEERKTGLITLSIEWYDPVAAAKWANELVALANENIRQRTIEEAKRSIAFLEQELGKTSVVERQQIIYNLIESKIREIMMANARKDYAFLVIDPAAPPQVGHFVRPRRALILAAGLFLGFLIGVAYASVRWVRAPIRGN